MSRNLEIESKVMIEKQGYKKLAKDFSTSEKYNQINYYISSKELQNKIAKYGIRIRKKNHEFELTLKEKNDLGFLEINQKITGKLLIILRIFHRFPSGEVLDYITKNNICNPQNLRIIGKLKTKRIDIKFSSSLISVDKSKYNHITDYEIECEDQNKNSSIQNLELFLSNNKISYKKSESTKLARFLKTKN